MERDQALDKPSTARRPPWNKGKLIGAKPPLRPSHVWSIRTKLQMADRKRDLALFNLAIDSKLRGCDVVALRVDDVAPSGYAMDRATIRQKKTGRRVRFELTDQTRLAVDDYLRLTGRTSGQFLFAGRGGGPNGLTTRQYARLVHEWVASIGLDPQHICATSPRAYNYPMAKKTTLEILSAQMQKGFAALGSKIEKLDERMERGFAAVADDIADVRRELKGDIVRVQEQVTSIEQQPKHGRYETRLGRLEGKVFGAPR